MRTCDATSDIISEFKVYMRYAGQGWEIPVALTEAQAMNPDAATFQLLFEEDYTKLFGRTVTGMDIEITVWSVNATTPPEKVARVAEATAGEAAKAVSNRALFDAGLGHALPADVINRDTMTPGQTVQGPAIITEDETTIIVPSTRRAIAHPDGTIELTLKGAIS